MFKKVEGILGLDASFAPIGRRLCKLNRGGKEWYFISQKSDQKDDEDRVSQHLEFKLLKLSLAGCWRLMCNWIVCIKSAENSSAKRLLWVQWKHVRADHQKLDFGLNMPSFLFRTHLIWCISWANCSQFIRGVMHARKKLSQESFFRALYQSLKGKASETLIYFESVLGRSRMLQATSWIVQVCSTLWSK